MKFLILLSLMLMQACVQNSELENSENVEINAAFLKQELGATKQETGTLEVRVTDAPFPYDFISRADIEVTEVEIRGKNGYTTISNIPSSYNLIELRAGLSEFLSEVELPVGTYDQIRLKVSSASVTLTNDKVFHLKVPSGSQSGIKVFLTPKLEITANSENTLTLDFDLAKSFVLRGNMEKVETVRDIRGFIFKPVIRAGIERNSGGLKGLILSDNATNDQGDDTELENVHITLLQNDEEIATASTIETGMFQFNGIEPGTYDVKFEINDHVTQIIENVEITLGEINTLDDITLAVEDETTSTQDETTTTQDETTTTQDETTTTQDETTTTQDETTTTQDETTTTQDVTTTTQDEITTTQDETSTTQDETTTTQDETTTTQDETPTQPEVITYTFEGTVLSNNGTPTDASDDTPISDAVITFMDDSGEIIETQRTDENGNFSTTLPEGNIMVTIEDQNHDPISAGIEFFQDIYVQPVLNQIQ